MTLYLVCDISGSMLEGGKRLIARGVACTVEQYIRLEYGHENISLVAWSKEAQSVEWMQGEEFPSEMLNCKGSANAAALLSFLSKQPHDKVLFITDGYWSKSDVKALKSWGESLKKDTLRFVKVGADANPQLKGANVFAAEDVFAALDGWLEGGKV